MLRPRHDKLLVRPLDLKASETLLVVTADKFSAGTVERCGPDVTEVKVGDRIRFGTTDNYLTYPEYREGNESFLILQEADVCFVEEQA